MGGRCDNSNIIILFLSVLFKSLHASDYYHPGSDDVSLNYDDCSTSSVAENLNIVGSGDAYIRYGDCNPSSVAYSVYSIGSGDTYITFGDRSYSSTDELSNGNYGDQWAQNIYNQGSGNLDIQFADCCSSTSILGQNLYVQGSGKLDVNYGTCSSSKSRMAQNVYNRGSGDILIEYRSCNTSDAVRLVSLVGSGDVIITYEKCGKSHTPKIVNTGSGKVNIICRNNRELTAKVARKPNMKATRNRIEMEYDRESGTYAAKKGDPDGNKFVL